MASLSVPCKIFETNLPEQVSKLITNGADVNEKDQFGTPALVSAAGRDLPEITKILIQNKADVNIQRETGSTALMRAARNGSAGVAKILIDNKADPKLTHRRSGETAADMAKANNHREVFAVIEPTAVASW